MDLSVIIVEYLDLKSLERAISSIYYNINNLITEIIVISNSSYSIKRQVEIRSNFCGPQFIFNDKYEIKNLINSLRDSPFPE